MSNRYCIDEYALPYPDAEISATPLFEHDSSDASQIASGNLHYTRNADYCRSTPIQYDNSGVMTAASPDHDENEYARTFDQSYTATYNESSFIQPPHYEANLDSCGPETNRLSEVNMISPGYSDLSVSTSDCSDFSTSEYYVSDASPSPVQFEPYVQYDHDEVSQYYPTSHSCAYLDKFSNEEVAFRGIGIDNTSVLDFRSTSSQISPANAAEPTYLCTKEPPVFLTRNVVLIVSPGGEIRHAEGDYVDFLQDSQDPYVEQSSRYIDGFANLLQ